MVITRKSDYMGIEKIPTKKRAKYCGKPHIREKCQRARRKNYGRERTDGIKRRYSNRL